MSSLVECISAFIACIGFALIFRVHQNFHLAIIASFGGALGWFIYLLVTAGYGEVIACFIAMAVVAFFSEIAARINKAPATIFLIIGCFPLVPGRGIYETMLYCTQGKNELFLNSFIHTLAISGSIAVAILVVSTIFKVIKKISYQQKKVKI